MKNVYEKYFLLIAECVSGVLNAIDSFSIRQELDTVIELLTLHAEQRSKWVLSPSLNRYKLQMVLLWIKEKGVNYRKNVLRAYSQ